MLFKEIEDTSNSRILFLFCLSKCRAAHMDMEPTGSGLMTGIAHIYRSGQYLCPGHLVLVIGQRHGVRYQLEPIVETAIMLAVEAV